MSVWMWLLVAVAWLFLGVIWVLAFKALGLRFEAVGERARLLGRRMPPGIPNHPAEPRSIKYARHVRPHSLRAKQANNLPS